MEFTLIIERTPFEKGASLKLSTENFHFCFFRIGRLQKYRIFYINKCALSEKKQIKVFGKGFGGDSPQCGEMSRSDRGARLRQRNLYSERVPPMSKHKFLCRYHGKGGETYDKKGKNQI